MPHKPITTLLLVCLLTGCATEQGTSALECGAGAAAAAAILCKLAGGNNETCAALAVGGGAGGAAICYSYANHIQKRRQELAGHERDLDTRIRYLRGVNEDTEALNKQLEAKVTAVTQSTDQIVASVARGQASQQQLAHQRKVLDTEVNAAQGQIATVAQELQSAQEFRAQQKSAPSSALDSEIERLQTLLNQAQNDTSALAAQRQRI